MPSLVFCLPPNYLLIKVISVGEVGVKKGEHHQCLKQTVPYSVFVFRMKIRKRLFCALWMRNSISLTKDCWSLDKQQDPKTSKRHFLEIFQIPEWSNLDNIENTYLRINCLSWCRLNTVWDIKTKILQVKDPMSSQLFTKFQVFWCTHFEFPAKTNKNLK